MVILINLFLSSTIKHVAAGTAMHNPPVFLDEGHSLQGKTGKTHGVC